MSSLKHSKFEPMWFKIAPWATSFSLLITHAPLLCHLRTPKTIAKVCISAHWRLFRPHTGDLLSLERQDDLTFIIFGVQNGLPWLNDSFQLPCSLKCTFSKWKTTHSVWAWAPGPSTNAHLLDLDRSFCELKTALLGTHFTLQIIAGNMIWRQEALPEVVLTLQCLAKRFHGTQNAQIMESLVFPQPN